MNDPMELVGRLEDPNYRGPMQHLRDWSEIDRLLTEAAACIRELLEWRPIETAPRDGAHVILTDGSNVWEGRFVDWSSTHRGWYERNNDPSDAWGGEDFPTHWRPLPLPLAPGAEA